MKRMFTPFVTFDPNDPPPQPAPVVTPPVPTESPTMRDMREKLDAANQEAKANRERAEAAERLITEADRAKLADNERLSLEKGDLEKKVAELTGKAGQADVLENEFKTMFEGKVAALPAELREKATNLTSGHSTFASKFKFLLELEPLLVPAVVPVRVGTPGAPPIPGVTPPIHQDTTPIDPKQYGNIDLMAEIQKAAKAPNSVV